MWIILLDRSSSMGEPFSATVAANRPGRKRKTRVSTKWQAANGAIVSEVGSVQHGQPVTLFAPNYADVLACDGISSRLDVLRSKSDAIKPMYCTDFAAALSAVHDHISGCQMACFAFCIPAAFEGTLEGVSHY
jgi:hypothetical protein